MARVRLELPEAYSFETTMTVRVSDINYGNHLGNDRMVSMLHEARLRFLLEHGFSELNIGGIGILVSDLVVNFTAEAFVAEKLRFRVGLTDFNKYGCDFIYQVVNDEQDKVIAKAKTGVVFFDYDERKISRIPQIFFERCAPEQKPAD